jgi:tRNA dimethylallyltransferase
MYFLQHLLFPGKLVSADTAEQVLPTSYRVRTIDDMDVLLRERVVQLPTDVQLLLFNLENISSISTPDAFPPGYNIEGLPATLRTPEEYTKAVYRCLQAVDPDMALRWHWRDVRKVTRSVQVYMQSGQPHSTIMREQSQNVQESQYVC